MFCALNWPFVHSSLVKFDLISSIEADEKYCVFCRHPVYVKCMYGNLQSPAVTLNLSPTYYDVKETQSSKTTTMSIPDV